MAKTSKPSLAETHPELAGQADGWDPETLTFGSGKRVKWKCLYSHNWFSTVNNRVKGNGCPVCSGRIANPGVNDLATLNPELAAQAEGWDPTTVTSFSHQKVRWKCVYSHTWEARVAERSSGDGCPFCSGHRVLVGFNDLATTHPDLAAQADGWDPTTVVSNTYLKARWICEQDHRWEALIGNRAKGVGCPICSGHRVLVGFNDLATTHPDLAAQADGWDPTTVVSNTNLKARWICEQDHRWEALIGNRAKGVGCPICSGHRVLVGFNDLATTHPELAAQADGWDPTTVSHGSIRNVAWLCSLGHKWNTTVSTRSSGSGCPVCTNRSVVVGFNDLATINPDLAAQADGWDPTTVVGKSGKRLQWKCQFGHVWVASIDNRAKGTGCPVCTNRSVVVGFNDLATINPDLAAQADGWDPTTVVSFSNKKVDWKCVKNHQWSAVISSRSSGNGCPYCSGLFVEPGVNDLASTNPELALQASGWDPKTLSANSNKKVKWICDYGHEWEALVASRTRGTGCSVCSGHKVLKGFNDLATLNPELAAQAEGWDPTTVTSQTHKAVNWKCSLGHKWKATVKNRFRSTGCPICSNKQLLIGFNDLATTNPELAAQADGWDPTKVFANTDKKLRWKCSKNHTWSASANNRSQGKDCPSCAEYGFNPGRDGWLYFIENDSLEMFQIGISNVLENRLKKHGLAGWSAIEVRGPMDGFLTQQLEANCLKALEKRGAILGHKAGITKFDGYSEAWTKASLNVTSIKQILDWVYEDESK